MKRQLQAILDETPSYDASLNLKADQVGKVLNNLISQITEVVKSTKKVVKSTKKGNR